MKSYKIPDFPKITLNNYISKLSNKVKVILETDIISEHIDDTILNELSLKLNLLKSSLKEYIRFSKYPLPFLKELDNISDKDIFYLVEQENPIFFSKWKLVNLPKSISPKLAYFVGCLQWDGCVESNGRRINFTDEYLEQIEMINRTCYNLFNIQGRIEGRHTTISKQLVYRLEIGSLVLNSYIHEIFGINRGIKTNLKIPSIIDRDKELLRWYLVGLFDADGTLPKEPKNASNYLLI